MRPGLSLATASASAAGAHRAASAAPLRHDAASTLPGQALQERYEMAVNAPVQIDRQRIRS